MQLSSVDQNPGLRPAGAGPASAHGQPKVVPVQPVNPPEPPPAGVVNAISPEAVRVQASEAVFRSVPDPIQKGAEQERPPTDWTIKRPQPQKVEEPPPEPISKRMLEFLRSMWRASGSVVELSQTQAQQVQNTPPNQHNPNATPGVLAKEALTYTPSKIRRNERI